VNEQFFGMQVRPENIAMHPGVQMFHEVFLGAWLLVSIIVGFVHMTRKGDRQLLICMMSGFLAVVLETHTIYMMKFFYPTIGQHVLIEGFGNKVPLLMGLEYGVFQGTATYLYLKKMTDSVSLWGFLLGMIALIAAEAAVEITSISYGVWYYFDDQPFTIAGFPIHVAVIVTGMLMINGALARIWFCLVSGAQQFWWLAVGPLLLIGIFTSLTFPVAFALQSEGGLPAARVGGLLSIGLSFLGSYYALKLPSFVSRVAFNQRRID
jgi:hypothetical protein